MNRGICNCSNCYNELIHNPTPFKQVIPDDFWAAHIAKEGHQFEALFTVYYKTWEMRVTKQNDNYFVHGGWLRFIRDNDIKVGCHCVFQPVDYRELHFRVTLVQAM